MTEEILVNGKVCISVMSQTLSSGWHILIGDYNFSLTYNLQSIASSRGKGL